MSPHLFNFIVFNRWIKNTPVGSLVCYWYADLKRVKIRKIVSRISQSILSLVAAQCADQIHICQLNCRLYFATIPSKKCYPSGDTAPLNAHYTCQDPVHAAGG